MGIKCFWLEPTSLERVSVRVWEQAEPICPGPYSNHCASIHIADVREEGRFSGKWENVEVEFTVPEWPTKCQHCDFQFTDAADRYVDRWNLMKSGLDGSLHTLRDAPPGAMWDASWMTGETHTGPDGITLCVQTPGGTWMVDSEASNCTRPQWQPQEDGSRHWMGRSHYCWPRKGDPRTGDVDVRKEHGETCSAGAGSIICGTYHGFLHNGFLTDA